MSSLACLLLLLVGLSQSAILLPLFPLSSDLIEVMAHNEGSGELSTCQDAQFNYCQMSFNKFFGLNDSITSRNGSFIFKTVQDYLDLNVTEVTMACSTYAEFYRCLGRSYHPCTNLNNMLRTTNSNDSNAFDYIRTFRGLEWICTGGFHEVHNKYDCLQPFPSSMSYRSCLNYFNQTVSTTNFCRSVQQTGDCFNNAYNSACGTGSGHFGCGNFRSTFSKSCPGLACMTDDN